MLIMTYATKSLSLVPAGAIRLAATAAGGVVSLVKAVIHRREVLRLSELDERGLKDIGLVRSDVEGALAVSWLRDPSAVLAARSDTNSEIAEARRDEGLRRSLVMPAAGQNRPARPVAGHTIACSA